MLVPLPNAEPSVTQPERSVLPARAMRTIVREAAARLKMREEFSWFAALPLIGVIAFSWAIAFFEYCLQVPANRLGFKDNGGPFDIMQLKVIQEVITLTVFTVFSMIAFKMELKWNHLAAFCCLILAVYFVFKK